MNSRACGSSELRERYLGESGARVPKPKSAVLHEALAPKDIDLGFRLTGSQEVSSEKKGRRFFNGLLRSASFLLALL